ncbi:MAG: hypothetical protein K2X82_28970, partial [Gemmataceae bacterium]|nr:hypothetical protein [Gemmataceae bacterium]
HRPDPAPSHRIVIPHPEPVVRRGDPLTLSAFAEPLSPDADPPDGAALVVRPAADRTGRRLPMRPDGAGAFHLTLPPVYDDFLYRVEAGGAASPWHTVRAADPVELADDTAVTVTPPAYTGATPVTRPGVEGVDGLQHSTAAFRLAFTRPAAVAFLTWQPATGVPDRPVVPVELGEGGLTGTATVRLTTDGVYRLVLATEPGLRQLRTEIAIPVRVTADAPPRFEALDGVSPRPVARPPNSRVEIAFTVADDLGVAGVVLEYVPGSGGEPKRESVPLTGAGTPRAEGRVTLDLAGNGAAGQTVRFRLRAADARAVPDANLTPQEGVYPPTGWAEVGLSASTPPADRQEADGLRDAARDALRGAADAVGAALAEVEALLGSDQFAAWPLDHAVRLESAREQVRAAAGQLHDAARELVLRPDLRPFAADIGATADGLHRTAAEWMGDAPPDRRAALRTAADRLGEASSRLDGLTARADRVTRDWLDRRRLAAVAADPRNVEARLRDILADSEPLRRAILRSAARDARRFAAEAEGIADRVGHLDAAARHLETEARRAVLGRL